FAHDLDNRDELAIEVVRMADAVASRLRTAGLSGRTVTLKVRFGSFTTITRSTTLAEPVDSPAAITAAAGALLDGIDPPPGVRLLGVSGSGWVEGASRQLTLDDVSAWDDAPRAVDDVRRRFGAAAIGPASLIGPDGLRLTRRGRQQWGPDD